MDAVEIVDLIAFHDENVFFCYRFHFKKELQKCLAHSRSPKSQMQLFNCTLYFTVRIEKHLTVTLSVQSIANGRPK